MKPASAFCHSASALCPCESYFVLSVPKKKSMPKSQFKAKHKGKKSKSHYKKCVSPCVRYLCTGDTHSLCVICLGARHAEAALEKADCPHCKSLPLLRWSGDCARGVRSAIWWRDRRWASLYLHPHLSDLMTAPRDWKPARRILPLNWPAKHLIEPQRGKWDERFI